MNVLFRKCKFLELKTTPDGRVWGVGEVGRDSSQIQQEIPEILCGSVILLGVTF